MKISLVMTTFNGEEFIEEELLSIMNQTRKPDEVLVFDDCSTDSTVEIVRKFIKENNLSNWHVFVNEFNKGWEKNFIDGLSSATGDILFTSDQDDVWHKDKIRIMSSVFENNAEAEVVMCNFKRFWYKDKIRMDTKVSGRFTKRKSVPHTSTVDHPGCSYCYKKSFFETVKNNWVVGFPNDALIFYSSWLYDVTYLCKDKLHFFRRHDKSVTTNNPPLLSRSQRAEWLETHRNLIKHLIDVSDEQKINKYANKLIKWYDFRIELIRNRKIFNAFRLIKYMRFYLSVRTWFTDIYVSLRKKHD